MVDFLLDAGHKPLQTQVAKQDLSMFATRRQTSGFSRSASENERSVLEKCESVTVACVSLRILS